MELDPEDVDWSTKSDVMVLLYARYDVPEAVAEAERRGLEYDT